MTRRMWSGTCAALTVGFAAVVMAQNPPSQAPPQNSTPPGSQSTRSTQSSSARMMTITGCLQRGSDSATGTSGSASSSRSASSGDFILTNASMGAASASSTAGTTGSSSASSQARSASGAGTQYRLDADASKLTPHVGHKVEVTGTLDSSASPGASSAAGSSTSTAAMSAPRLKVDSVKMVSSTCP
jgi:hypothetical protein